jgi:Leucine-rich repeat (LRR) protein
MKATAVVFVRILAAACAVVALSLGPVNAQVSPDSTALVAIYTELGGGGWTNSTNWNTETPISTWYGVTVNGSNRVQGLSLGSNNLSGTIPAELWTLSSLESLDMWGNSISGQFPASIAAMSELRFISLQRNLLDGTLPSDIGGLVHLQWLVAEGNAFTGSLPTSLGDLDSLHTLDLGENLLSGPIPMEIGRAGGLQNLLLDHNTLSGAVPDSIGNLTQLMSLDLGQNGLTGAIPSTIGNLTNLSSLQLTENSLSGDIPPELWDLPSLQWLNLYKNDLTGTIPPEVGNLEQLQQLSLGYNDLTGTIPAEVWTLTNLEILYLNYNTFSGGIPDAIGNLVNLRDLALDSSSLTGVIPSSIGNLVDLQMLQMQENDLSGAIPSSIGNLVDLQMLQMQGNNLSGTIPAQIASLTSLEVLDLAGNQLSGPIPTGIGNLTALQNLYLQGNQLSGTIPASIGNLTQVQMLWLQFNNLTGSIPAEIGGLASVIDLDLQMNQLSGEIPDEICNLTSLQWLALSNNQLSGAIPANIGDLTAMQGCILQSNQLTGTVPGSITNLTSIQNLWLGSNQLTGLPNVSTLSPTGTFLLDNNLLQFGDLEPNKDIPGIGYAPQSALGEVDSVEANAGGNVTLDAVVSGSNNSYQWYKDGGPLAGETNPSLTLNAVTAADNGSYSADVTSSIVTGLTLQTAAKVLSVTDSLRIAVSDTVAPASTQMLLPVTIENAAGFDVVSFELKVAFDPAIAQPGTPDATEIAGTPVASWSIEENVIPGGARDTLLVAASTADQALDAAGTLLWLVFDVQAVVAPNATPVELVEVLFNDGTPGAIGTDGAIEIIVPVQTDEGTDVTVSLVDQETGSTPVDMTFDEVTGVGSTTMITLEEASNPFPEGFQVTQDVIVFDLVTTADFADSITVTYDYTGATVGDESLLRLLHYEVDQWVDITTSLDTVSNILTGRVFSLSEFGVGQSTGVDGVVDTDPDAIGPGADVTITVDDANENKEAGVVEHITVLAFDVDNADSQEVVLEETGASTGVFAGVLSTEFADGGTTVQDGVLGLVAGDTVYVAYTDVLNSESTTDVKKAFSEVIGGADGALLASIAVQALDGRQGVRDTVRVQVSDADGNAASGTAEELTVTVTNLRSGEVEDLTLPETDLDTGVFRIRVPTVTTAPVDNDGELSLEPDDTLSVVYEDALTAVGNAVTLSDTVQVVSLFGDVQQNDKVQAFDAAFILATSVGNTTATRRDSLLMDVDGSGTVKAFDASYVLQYVVRLIARFPVQTDSMYNPPGDNSRNHPFLKPVSLEHVIALGQIQPLDDGAYRVPVRLGERTGVLSATLELTLAPGLQVTDVEGGEGYGGFMTAHHAQNGVTRVAFAGGQSDREGPGDILWITLQQTEEGPVQLSLDSVSLNGVLLTPDGDLGAIQDLREEASDGPLVFALHPNFPNPFNPSTTIRYDVPEASDVRIVVYNTLGQEVSVLLSSEQQIGSYAIVWDGRDAVGRMVSSGIYVIRMTGRDFTQARKVLLLK